MKETIDRRRDYYIQPPVINQVPKNTPTGVLKNLYLMMGKDLLILIGFDGLQRVHEIWSRLSIN